MIITIISKFENAEKPERFQYVLNALTTMLNYFVTYKQNNIYAFAYVISVNDNNMLRELLSDPHAPIVREHIPFMIAAKHGNTEAVQILLLDKRADPNGIYDQCPFNIAAQNGYAEIMELLYSRTNSAFYMDKSLYETAIEKSFVDVIRFFHRRNGLLAKFGIPTIHASLEKASKKGDADIVEIILKHPDVNPAINENTPIRNAARAGQLEIVRILLADQRVDPGAKNNEALEWSARNGHINVVRLLLSDPRVDPTANNYTAFRHALSKGKGEVVKIFLADDRIDIRVIEMPNLSNAMKKLIDNAKRQRIQNKIRR